MTIQAIIVTYWPALIFGLFGLAFRWSRMGLPNGGNEPKTRLEQFSRLARLWIEATAGSVIFVFSCLIATKFYEPLAGIAFPALSLASLLGAATSDMIGKFLQNPASVFDWVRDAVLRWVGK